MKFAKELETLAIPEWSGSYLDYKQAKKRLKAVAKALRGVPGPARQSHHPELPLRGENGSAATPSRRTVDELSPLQTRQQQPGQSNGESDQLKRMTSYGSIIGSPPNSPALRIKHSVHDAPSLHLPGPAANSLVENSLVEEGEDLTRAISVNLPIKPRPTINHASSQLSHVGNAYEVTPPVDRPDGGSISRHGSSRLRGLLPKRTISLPGGRPFTQRMLSLRGATTPKSVRDDQDVALELYKEVDFREAEFFLFLDKELMKVESFYKGKEDEAKERLETLRQQLHIMREFRLQEIMAAEQRHKHGHDEPHSADDDAALGGEHGRLAATRQMVTRPFHKSLDVAAEVFDKFKPGHVGKTSQAMGNLGTPDDHNWTPEPHQRDYSRKPLREVPYRVAKRKMKMALQEYYRGLELVKSFAMANRTAFRKINKKYDKTVNANPKQRYMVEKVNKSYFVTSDEVDSLMSSVEDLYSRYFEKGNRKIAVNKLRAKNARQGHYTGAVVRTGALFAAGTVLALQGIVAGTDNLYVPDAAKRMYTGYLLQLYGGYFLILLLATLFALSTRFFTVYKVNYQFIFELDNRHALNWRELCEMPAWFFFIFGLTMYLNFSVEAGADTMYPWWFVVLLGLALLFLFNPAPIFYHHARRWFLYSMWRLILAGLYSVEYRDFFLGDIFCSLTYAMGNVEVFFCLYTNDWASPGQCTSGKSRLLGFLTTLPAIWRANQCLRRYWDTRTWFPHLANFGKYIFTILMYMSLSLYRIEKTFEMKALFIALATINSVYTSIWDICMDWSLGDWDAKHPLLRRTLAYRQHIWLYYFAMILDPILRFSWIFYAIYTHDAQHATIVSFAVALTEVFRRALWALFRVENEHCSNIKKAKASRDLPLPYKFITEDEDSQDEGEHRSQKSIENVIAAPFGSSDSHGPPASLRDPRGLVATSDISSMNLDQSKPQKPIKPRSLLRRGTNTTSETASKETRFTNRDGTVVRKDGSVIEVGPAGSATATGRSDIDLERQVSGTGGSSLRVRKGNRSGEGSAPGSDSPIASALQRVGTAIRSAHEKDFERKKKPTGKDAEAAEDELESSDEDDEEEEENEDIGRDEARSG